ncbi:MAG: prepilin-type N-terminal cleavage/methylation domain-containing protein [Proteobacteria bacterium]|nr:prepilin-type N-terminal cleavage/methylation domain-containing protein [Pseudomonadota bacterium]
MNKKIAAFTLSEMIVVLILTSIVVGLAFSVLTLVQKHMHTIQNNFKQNTELNKLEQSLWLDFNRYSKINYDALENELRFATEIDSITYTFNNQYIVKDIDTFHIQINSKTLFFDGNFTEKGIIDAIKLETSKTFQNQKLFVFKQNDATLFMD